MASIPLLRFSLHSTPKTLNKPYLTTTTSPVTARLPHPLKSTVKLPSLPKSQPRRSPITTTTAIRMSYSPTPATDRLISAVAYVLPFFNGLQYGRHLFIQYPILGSVFEPILPLLSLYRSVPYASFVAFFAIYLGIVRNPSFSRYVRFNVMQAVVLDVLLVIACTGVVKVEDTNAKVTHKDKHLISENKTSSLSQPLLITAATENTIDAPQPPQPSPFAFFNTAKSSAKSHTNLKQHQI